MAKIAIDFGKYLLKTINELTISQMDIAKRFKNNPILRPADLKPSMPGMKIECLLNPGVFSYQNKTWLLLRVAEMPEQQEGKISFPIYNESGRIEILTFDKSDPALDFTDPRVINYKGKDYLTTLSHLRLVCSDGGEKFYEPEGYAPIFGSDKHEAYGIEDCRVINIDGTYNLTYTQVSSYGVGVGLIQTKDWKNLDRKGMIFSPHNKDCAIFEEKINGKYYALHRPSSPQLGGNYIWIAESPDLLHWGNHKCIATSRKGMWDSARVGAGAAPIKTPHGWLEIYHGANEKHRYCLGALLLDLNDPSKVLARSEEPFVEPTAQYELTGFFGNVVFTNGHIVEGDTVRMYYGASDEVICMAELSIKEILSTLNR
ncbi:MAG TPA: glycoside hydrolase family 130 protein [Cyclobacteriaceae bacterium]|nr:glycoside hydrolase family 130 protein [Cyclobacteriaceae bacterium]HMV09152.1 glycoside hydrolase family 130 protein [Cyclobacteriaceae bacterium]HMV91218.1 glycoside hydrolase family 130 protein [Cyclobacteriaceae bacterium]HMX01479.1 glycoside hydrolase family 130 protein [Cyclobacteriaceae bacterium]HMX50251.1 glycoside hydrolase family 130 protein [Cyclobacteriaceae bacterium]